MSKINQQLHINQDGVILFFSTEGSFMYYGYWKSATVQREGKVDVVEIKKIAKVAFSLN